MKRDFTRRRRDKGTQVNKRSAHTQGTKYGLKKSGQLGLLMISDVSEGVLMSKEEIMRHICNRKLRFQEKIPNFIYECLKRIQELDSTDIDM